MGGRAAAEVEVMGAVLELQGVPAVVWEEELLAFQGLRPWH